MSNPSPHPAAEELISWVYTEQFQASVDFYGRVLGLPCVRDQGMARIYRVGPRAMIGVCTAYEDRVVEPRGSMLSVVTRDVDAWYARVAEAGAVTRGPPRHLPRFGIYAFFAEDPDGHVIEFQRFVDNP